MASWAMFDVAVSIGLEYSVSFADATDNDDDFTKWEKEVKEAEAAAAALKKGTVISGLGSVQQEESVLEEADTGLDNRPATPPDGEEEFTDDDGTTYKWDRGLRAWVPQVCVSAQYLERNGCLGIVSCFPCISLLKYSFLDFCITF